MKKISIIKAFSILATTATVSYYGYNHATQALKTEQKTANNVNLFPKHNHLSFSSMSVNYPQYTDDVHKQRIIILAGPGGDAFNKNSVLALKTAFAKQGAVAEIIGDGESNITEDEIKLALSSLKQNARPTTVVILSHGVQKNGMHHMVLGDNNLVDSCKIFTMFTKILDTKVDFFTTFCNGGGALSCCINMPDSTIVALSPATECTSGFDVDKFCSELSRNDKKLDLSAHSLLKLYLATALKNRIAPLIADKHGVKDLSNTFCSLLNNPLTNKEKAVIYQELDFIIERKEIDRLLSIISEGKEFGITAKDYGSALLISMFVDRSISIFSEYQPHNTCSECNCRRHICDFSSIYRERQDLEKPQRTLNLKIMG